MKNDINHLFVVAKNNTAALKELTNMLFKYGLALARNIIQKYRAYKIGIEDIEDYILEIINYVYLNYEPGKKSFSDYVSFVLYKRLTSKIVELYASSNLKVISFDDTIDETFSVHEVIEDRSCNSIPDEISLSEFNLRMSSPNASDSSIDLKKKKIYSLEQIGYSGPEIIKLLRLTEGQYRYLKSLIKEDIKMEKMKIDLK